jgi:hypothetical protein
MAVSGRKELQRALALSDFLFALNAWICHKLFAIEFTHLHNNAGAFMAIGRFYREHWRDLAWLPWFDAGKPIEYAYQPLLPALTAVLNWLSPWSIARCYEVTLATIYCLGPVALFWFAWEWSASLWLSFLASLTYSLVSPSPMFIPVIRVQPAGIWAAQRLYNLVYYGEGPHNLAITLLPLGLLFLHRAMARRDPRSIAGAIVSCAAVVLSNAFGAVGLGIGALCIAFALRRGFVIAVVTALGAWLWASPFLPPSLIATIARNAWTARGSYNAGMGAYAAEALLVLSVALIWFFTRRLQSSFDRFVLLFAPWMFLIPIFDIDLHITIVPQANRYLLELDMAACLLFAVVTWRLLTYSPRPARIVLLAALVILMIHQGRAYRNFAHDLIRPVDITKTAEYKLTKWTDRTLPGERTMVGGDTQWLFNVWSDNPQLGAGHEPTAPNFVQQMAVYEIYTGQNAGSREAATSILWLKAFGVTNISVPGPDTREYLHPFVNPFKFDGLLPVLRRQDGDTVYGVPMPSRSLAHVIPAEAVVGRGPMNGLDAEPAVPYVAALDDPALPNARIQWTGASRAIIRARMSRVQVISVQITYNPAWRASSGGHSLRVRKDGLGLIVIDPVCDGDCEIDLHYGATTEIWFCRVMSTLVCAALTAVLFAPRLNGPLAYALRMRR